MERACVQGVVSTPHRFFANNINYPESGEAELSGEEFLHARSVLRVAAGDEIVLLDGAGKEYSAIVNKVEKTRLLAHITGVNCPDREARTQICLLCGALKGDKTELIVQKATELGVAKIGVFSSRFCSAYMNQNKLERLNKVAREAAKQCLRTVAPKVEYFPDFAAALASAEGFENKLFFCEFAKQSETEMTNLKGGTALVVGSEGGFASEEYDLAREKYGFKGITLGKRILRAETAAITACALAAFCLGELK